MTLNREFIFSLLSPFYSYFFCLHKYPSPFIAVTSGHLMPLEEPIATSFHTNWASKSISPRPPSALECASQNSTIPGLRLEKRLKKSFFKIYTLPPARFPGTGLLDFTGLPGRELNWRFSALACFRWTPRTVDSAQRAPQKLTGCVATGSPFSQPAFPHYFPLALSSYLYQSFHHFYKKSSGKLHWDSVLSLRVKGEEPQCGSGFG